MATITEFTDDTPIVMLTIGQLKEVIMRLSAESLKPSAKPSAKRRGFGLQAIMTEFGVSKGTAQRYKDTFLAPAVAQVGRSVVVDLDLANQLFKAKNNVGK